MYRNPVSGSSSSHFARHPHPADPVFRLITSAFRPEFPARRAASGHSGIRFPDVHWFRHWRISHSASVFRHVAGQDVFTRLTP
jgi:hypothetical protein